MRSILYISIFFQGDAAIAVRVIHVEQNWGTAMGRGAQSERWKGSLGPPGPPTFPTRKSISN